MEERINALRSQMEEAIAGVQSKEALAEFWQQYLSKNGSINKSSLRPPPSFGRRLSSNPVFILSGL